MVCSQELFEYKKHNDDINSTVVCINLKAHV
jgi:hypothetical protein